MTLKLRGLYTHANPTSETPDGALQVADDIVIDRESIAQPRRGFDRLANGFSDAAYRANKLIFYKNKLIAHFHTNLMAHYTTTWNTFSGTYIPPANGDTTSSYARLRIRHAEANQNLYITTGNGVRKLDNPDSTPIAAGGIKALDIQADIPSVPVAPWLSDDHRVAYRIIWGYKDANNNLILGAPSQRESIKNTSGFLADVRLQITIPDGITTAWFYQIYRSISVDNSAEDIEPNDELGLVYEGNPSSAEITAKLVTVVDITPDELRGATIYTAATQEGLAAGNEAPPLAKDIAVFKNTTFYANTTSKHRYYLTLLAAGGANGIAVGDTLTIGGVTYTAGLIENISTRQFRVSTGSFTFVDADVDTSDDTITKTAHGLSNGDRIRLSNSGGALPTGLNATDTYFVVSATANTLKLSATFGGAAIDITGASGAGTHTLTYLGGSASQNIRDTSISLIRVINRNATSTVTAFYLSGPDDLPGKMLIEEEGLGGTAFALTSVRASVSSTTDMVCWSPSLPRTGTTESSTNDAFKNGVSFSKQSQPEAVPLPNFFLVGSAQEEILRIVPLRDSLFVLKEDGIYRISGEDASSFRVDLFDATTRLIAPESAVVLNNQIYALTDQGVVAITEGGVQVKSRPIEADLLSLLGLDIDALRNLAFAVSYETERKYILFVPTIAGDVTATQAYVYNTFTNTWTRWVLTKNCGVVDPRNDKLYLGDGRSNFVNVERKSLSYLDYVDYAGTTTITAISGNIVTVASVELIRVGDALSQTNSGVVTAVDPITREVTLTSASGFTAASVNVLHAIRTRVSWVPFTGGNPGVMKHLREILLMFKKDFSGDASVVFLSDISGAPEPEDVVGSAIGRWGRFPWGRRPWGGLTKQIPHRIVVPLNKQRCTQLSVEFRHGVAFTEYQMSGISIVGHINSERVVR
jgi:hypothetical protein